MTENYVELDNSKQLYKLYDVAQWTFKKEIDDYGKEFEKVDKVYYFHDKLADKIVQNEIIYNTMEFGLFIYSKGYYKQIIGNNNDINHIISSNFGNQTENDKIAENFGFRFSDLPQKRVCLISFKREVEKAIYDKLDQFSFYEIFNTIPFKSPDFCISVKNGLYNLETEMLLPHDHNYKTSNRIDSNYEDVANNKELGLIYDEWIEYVYNLVKSEPEEPETDQKKALWFQEMLGRALCNVWTGKEHLWEKGPSNSGKTTFNNCIMNTIGVKNRSNVKFHQLDPQNDRYATSSLPLKTVNFSNDTKDVFVKDVERFMNINSDPFQTREIYAKQIEVMIYQLWIISINSFPKGDFKTEDKFLNRTSIILFKRVIQEKIDDYDKIWKSEERKTVILYWLLEGLTRYRTQGYSYIQSEEEKLLLMDQESFSSFFEDCLELGNLTQTDISDVDKLSSFSIMRMYNKRAELYGLNKIKEHNIFNRKFWKFIKEEYENKVERTRAKITRKRKLEDRTIETYKKNGYFYKGLLKKL